MLITIDIDKIIDTVYALSAMRHVVDSQQVPAVFNRDNRHGLHRLLCDSFMTVVAQLPLRRVLDFGPDIYSAKPDDGQPAELPAQLWLDYDVPRPRGGYSAALAAAVRLQAEALVYGQKNPTHAAQCRSECLRQLTVLDPGMQCTTGTITPHI